jgi:ABC-type Fe3+ transport system permease subunit
MSAAPHTPAENLRAANYAAEWRRYKRLRNLTLAVLIGGCALDFLSPAIYQSLTGAQDDSKFSAIIFVVWAVACVLVSAQLMKWKCPRCGNVFSGGAKTLDSPNRWFDWIVLPKQCVSCGLPKFALSPDADQAPSP